MICQSYIDNGYIILHALYVLHEKGAMEVYTYTCTFENSRVIGYILSLL